MGQRGRPRGPNYEINLQRRLKAAERRAEKNETPAPASQQLVTLTKSLYRALNNDRFQGKQPVLSAHERQQMSDGLLLRHPGRPGLEDLRNLSFSNSLIGAIHRVRVDDLGQFARAAKDAEGYAFELADADRKPNRNEQKLMQEAAHWFEHMGDTDRDGWSRRDRFQQVFQYMVRDLLSIDAVAIWLVRNKKGALIECQYLDPATIFPVDERSGFRGDTSVGFVQMIAGEYVETFGHEDILLRHQNQISDIRYRGTGLSPTEVSVMEIVSLLNGLKYNRQRFSNNPPPGFMSVVGTLPDEALEALQIQWENMFAHNENNFRIPIISSDAEVKWNPLQIQSDIAFEKLLQWMTTFVLIAHGMDQAELGLKLMGSSSLSESSTDGRIQHSMTRSKKALLSCIADVMNEIRERAERFEPLVFRFKGVDPEDEDKLLDRDQKRVKSYELVDEVRARRDLPTLGEAMKSTYKLSEEEYGKVRFMGATLLDSTWMQAGGSMLQSLAGGDDEPESSDLGGDGEPVEGGFADGDDEDEDFEHLSDEELAAFGLGELAEEEAGDLAGAT